MESSLARIAHMYYEQRLTQQEIANQLGYSRIQISRLLQQARNDGIVTISITYDGYYPELEHSLKAKFPGTDFVVVDGFDGDINAVQQAIAVSAGSYISNRYRDAQKIAVGWGRTMSQFAQTYPEAPASHMFVPMVGGQTALGLEYHANYIASQLAQRTGGEALTLLAPAVASSIDERNTFVTSPQVAPVVHAAASAEVAVFSIGAPFAPHSTLREVGYFTEEDIELLRSDDAACDIISTIYFDSNGKECAASLASRTVGVDADQLRGLPNKVCLAGGLDKAQAIRIALHASFVDVLITDRNVAQTLLA